MAEHETCSFDIFKTISGYYQVVCTAHNMVIGPSYHHRKDAEAKMDALYDEMYGMPGEEPKVVHEYSAGAVPKLPPSSPGVDTHSDTKKITY